MKIGIDLLASQTGIPRSKYSHNAGMSLIYKHQLEMLHNQKITIIRKEPWDEFDLIYLDHGTAFKGLLNLFGGAVQKNAQNYERLKTKTKLISLGIEMPNYGELCKDRLSSCDDYWKKVDWDLISEKCKNTDFIQHVHTTDKLVLGDSHSMSAWLPYQMIIRKDGRTLAGVLRKSIRKEINDGGIDPNSLNQITLYFGNIDVRHHILRNENPEQYIDSLLAEYEKQILELGIKNVEIMKLLPIESESRKLPKTGYFKNTPFFGSQQERARIRKYFNQGLELMCKRNNFIFSEIEKFDDMHIMDYETEIMEKPGSVHIAPLYYRTDFWPLKKQILIF
jgi:hypothetical protein